MGDWVGFRRDYFDAASALVNGDWRALTDLYASDEAVTIFGAFGEFESGSDAVRARVRWAGIQLSDGSFSEELLTQWIGPDTALTCSVETFDVRVAKSPTKVHQVLRVTQHYRRGVEGWRITHRHADLYGPRPRFDGVGRLQVP